VAVRGYEKCGKKKVDGKLGNTSRQRNLRDKTLGIRRMKRGRRGEGGGRLENGTDGQRGFKVSAQRSAGQARPEHPRYTPATWNAHQPCVC